MKIAAHGIGLELPGGWEGRIYRLKGGDPILHAASFALPVADGDFGSGATAAMPAGGAFLALKEHRPGSPEPVSEGPGVMTALILVGCAAALVAAVRSAWSP